MRAIFIATMVVAGFTGSAGQAATNLVINGDFEHGYSVNTEFNTFYHPERGPTGWVSQGYQAFNLYFDAATATTVGAMTSYGSDRQDLAPAFYASPTGGKFVALDGDSTNNGPLTQLINNLTVGQKYAVAFDWGASQLQNRQGPTTEQLQIGFGDAVANTAVVANGSQGFTGWMHEDISFVATARSQLLSFLSLGTPVGLPPLAVLDGVSVTVVPEPAAWVMMVAGFGLVGYAARRRGRSVVA